MHVNASVCIEAVLLSFYKSHTIDQYYTAWIRLTCELSYCVMRFSQEANIASFSGSGIDFGNVLFKYVSKIYLPSMESKSHTICYQILQLLNSMLSDIDCELFVCFSLGLKVQNLPREESAVSCRFLLRTEEIKCRCFNNHGFYVPLRRDILEGEDLSWTKIFKICELEWMTGK